MALLENLNFKGAWILILKWILEIWIPNYEHIKLILIIPIQFQIVMERSNQKAA